jgi:hypothetical protein
MVKVFFIGQRVKSMMGSGLKELKKVMEFGRVWMEIHTLDNGRVARQMGMEFTHGRMGIGMKENGNHV